LQKCVEKKGGLPLSAQYGRSSMPVCTVHRARIGSFVTSGVFDRLISKLNLFYETPVISNCFGVLKASKKVVDGVLRNEVYKESGHC
jgi:hypothetical protein